MTISFFLPDPPHSLLQLLEILDRGLGDSGAGLNLGKNEIWPCRPAEPAQLPSIGSHSFPLQLRHQLLGLLLPLGSDVKVLDVVGVLLLAELDIPVLLLDDPVPAAEKIVFLHRPQLELSTNQLYHLVAPALTPGDHEVIDMCANQPDQLALLVLGVKHCGV